MHTSLYKQYARRGKARSRLANAFSWEQTALGAGLLVIGYLFVHLGNGFPPRAWEEFVQFVTGQRIGQSFAPVLLLSCLYLVGWLLLLLTGLHVLRPGYFSQSRQSDTHRRRVMISPPVQEVERDKPGRGTVYKPVSANSVVVSASRPAPALLIDSGEKPLANQESTFPGLLTQLIASSREYTAPTAFCLRGNMALPEPSEEPARSALTGAFLCQPGWQESGQDTLVVASGLCHAPTYAASPDLAPYALFIIAGGHTDARMQQEVSRVCVRAISYALCDALARNASFTAAGIESLLGKSVQRTNAILYQHNQKHKTASAATVTAILIVGGIAFIAHVGNHRAYLYRPHKGVKLLTRGRAAPAMERQAREVANVCNLGEQALVHVQTRQVRLQADDLLVFCSHGLWRHITRDAFLQFLTKNEIGAKQPPAAQICRALLQTAPASPGDEPISALVARAGLH